MKCKITEKLDTNTICYSKCIPNSDFKKFYIAFFIKDTDTYLSAIGKLPLVQTRAVIYNIDGFKILSLLFRFNDNDDLIYSLWFDYFNVKDRECINKLMKQTDLSFTVVNENNESVTNFKIPNSLIFKIAQFCKEGSKEYNSHIFENLVSAIINEYENDLSKLWDDSTYIDM